MNAQCPVCGGTKVATNATCTRSYCQEADFYTTMAKSSRGRNRKDYEGRAREATRKAQEIGGIR